MSRPRIRWRREVLLLSILGMDATWLTPWTSFLAGTGREPGHGLSLGGVLALLVAALLVTRLLVASRLPLGAQQFLAGLLAVAGGLFLIGAGLYPERPFVAVGWLSAWAGDLARSEGYGVAGLVYLGLSLYAWGRGISLAQSRLETGPVGFYLRWGIVAWFWLQVCGLLWRVDAPLAWLFLYFLLGLLAVGLSRVEEVHNGRGAVRSPFTASWLLIMAGSAAGAMGLGFLATAAFSRGLVLQGWRALRPLGIALQWLLYQVVRLTFLVLSPFLAWLQRAFAPVARQLGQVPTLAARRIPSPQARPTGVPPPVQAIVWGAAVLVFLGILALVVTVLREREAEGDAAGEAGASWGVAGAERTPRESGVRRLRARLAGAIAAPLNAAYGLASVREIYASLLRLAAGRGLARGKAETPNEFRQRLDGSWPEAGTETASITEAYVRVRYGERRVTAAELGALQVAWQRLRERIEKPDATR